MRLVYVSSTDPFSLARNFESHQRHVSARRFDKKLFPRLLDMQHRQTDERQVYIHRRSMKDVGGQNCYDRKRREVRQKIDGGRKSRGTKYIRRVQWYCQLRDANKQTSRCISNPTAESLRFASGFAAVIFIIWDLQCLVSIVRATCLRHVQRSLRINTITRRKWLSSFEF